MICKLNLLIDFGGGMENPFGSERAWLLALAVGIGVGIGVGLFIFPFLYPLIEIKNAAAWIQVFGFPVTAIVGYFFIKYEFRLKSDKENKQKQRQLNDFKKLLKSPERVSKGTIDYLKSTDVRRDVSVIRTRVKSIERWMDFVDRVDFLEDPYRCMAVKLLSIRFHLEVLRDVCIFAINNNGSLEGCTEDLLSLEIILKANFSEIESATFIS